MHNNCMGLNENLTKQKIYQLKKSNCGLKIIFSQKSKNKIVFCEKMKTQVSPQYSSLNRRYSYSPTALGRETSQHDCEAKAGNFLAKTQTNIG